MEINTQAVRDRAAIDLLKFLMEKTLQDDREYVKIEDLNMVLMVADKKVLVPFKDREVEVI